MPHKKKLDAMTTTGARQTWHRIALWISAWLMILGSALVLPAVCDAEPMDYNGCTTTGFQGFFSWIDGRIGFEQENLGAGTLNNLIADLGLPTDNQSYRVVGSVRPLEHHLLRIFGTIPERYKGSNTLARTLVTRNFVYPAGSQVESELRTAMFGFGYDLDFLIGPRWFGGLNGDFRYIDLRVGLGPPGLSLPDRIALSELVPCIGAHFESRFPFGWDAPPLCWSLGAFARMTYGINPNFFNFVDVSTGLSVLRRPMGAPLILNAKVGYELESYFNNQENIAGRTLELRREGFFVSVEGAF
ncbi:MAG TPA: hypothetical protein VMC85_14295 [Desulfomonilaceae bacterium]|nr:hypothetical protein [Desulfomonilaceae bacterium]